MRPIHSSLFTSRVALILLVLGLAVPFTFATPFNNDSPIRNAIRKVPLSAGPVVDADGDDDDIQIVNRGQVVYTGPMDVTSTLDRIRANSKLPGNIDGAVWSNPRRLLPRHPSGYYHQFVVWPSSNTHLRPFGIQYPGPARVVLGMNGEVYFSGNSLSTFQFVN